MTLPGHVHDTPRSASSDVAPRHPEVGEEVPDLDLPQLKAFSLRGMLMHAMLSYRVASEGVGKRGTGLVKELYDELLRLSVNEPELFLPPSGLGKFPHFLKQPRSCPENQVKVFWDKECLLDGQSWLEGFILGLSHSMVIVPMLSASGRTGSIGEMVSLKDIDRVDNVLLELILALELFSIGDTSVQAILPVFIGEMDGDKFQPFPFHITKDLPDFPSQATNARAATIMRQLGLPEQAIARMMLLSVKAVVSRITQMQGVQLSDYRSRSEAVSACATRALKTIKRAIRDVQSAPGNFQFLHPMGAEVLDWLGRVSLLSYGPVFASHDLHSIGEIASLANDDTVLQKLCQTHDEMYPTRNSNGSIGDFVKLKQAVTHLKGRPEGKLLAERLEIFCDKDVSYRTCMFSANGVETAMAMWPSIFFLSTIGLLAGGYGLLMLIGMFLSDQWSLPTADGQGFVQPLTLRYSSISGGVLFIITGLLVFTAVYLQVYSTPKRAKRQCDYILTFLFCGLTVGSVIDGVQCSMYDAFGMICGGQVPMITVTVCVLLLLCRFRQEHFWTAFMLLVACFAGFFFFFWIDYEYWRLAPLVIFVATFSSLVTLYLLRLITRRDSNQRVVEVIAAYRAVWDCVDKASCADVANMSGSVKAELGRQFRNRKRTGVFGPLENLKREEGRYSLRNWSKVRQATKDIDMLFAQATTINATFQDTMWDMVYNLQRPDFQLVTPSATPTAAGEGPSLTKNASLHISKGPAMLRAYMEAGPVKRPTRAIQKVVRTYLRDEALLTDLVRSTVVLEDVTQVKDFLAQVLKQSVVGLEGHIPVEGARDGLVHHATVKATEDDRLFRLVALKNRFDEGYKDVRTGGYRDLQMNVEVGWAMELGHPKLLPVRLWESTVSERHICEIQIHLKDIYQVKMKFHTLYIDWRNMLTV